MTRSVRPARHLSSLERGLGPSLCGLALVAGMGAGVSEVHAQASRSVAPLPSLHVGATVRAPQPGVRPGTLVTLRLERKAPGAGALAGLGMQRAVELAVQSQPSIRAALASLAQQASGVEVARAGYRPQVRAGLAAGRQAEGHTGQQGIITASQMLYDFGKVDGAVAQADAARLQQRAQVLLQIDDLALDTAVTLLEAHREQVLASQTEALVAALRDIVSLTELRAAAGATSQADPITARARLEAAQANLLNHRSLLRQQRSKLQNLISRPLPEQLLLPTGETFQGWSQAPAPELASLPAMQVALAELELSRAVLARTQALQKPTITLDAGLSKPLSGLANSSRGVEHSLMVNLSSNLYQGGAESAQVESAVQGTLAAEAKVASKQLEIQERWRQLAEEASGLRERVQVLTSRQAKLQETRALYREQYLSLGSRSVLDLLNTEQEIFQAMADQRNAQHDLWRTQLHALHATGQMRKVFSLGRVQGLDIES